MNRVWNLLHFTFSSLPFWFFAYPLGKRESIVIRQMKSLRWIQFVCYDKISMNWTFLKHVKVSWFPVERVRWKEIVTTFQTYWQIFFSSKTSTFVAICGKVIFTNVIPFVFFQLGVFPSFFHMRVSFFSLNFFLWDWSSQPTSMEDEFFLLQFYKQEYSIKRKSLNYRL